MTNLLRLLLGVLLTLAGTWLWWWLRQGRPVLGVLGAMVLMGLHVPVLALEFLLMHRVNADDPAPRATWLEVVAAWWAECRLGVQTFAWAAPFRSRRWRDRVPVTPNGRRGVVLVHGFVCNRGVWNAWLAKLTALDIAFVAVDLDPPFGSIDGYAQTIGDAVASVTRITGRPPVVVAHSMGGLATRAWLRHHAALASTHATADAPVHRVFTLGTPHFGTAIKMVRATVNAREMASQGPWVSALSACESPMQRANFTCFYSHCDNIVFPASTATLPGADNRHVRGVAHLQLLEVPAIFDAVIASLD